MLLNGCTVNVLATHFKIFKIILSVYSCFFEKFKSFNYFSAPGSEMGGEVEPIQKATLFPGGSALHPIMNGVLKNITLGTRLFFIPHNGAICPTVSCGVSVQSANETSQRCACVRITTSPLGCRLAFKGGSGLQVGHQIRDSVA